MLNIFSQHQRGPKLEEKFPISETNGKTFLPSDDLDELLRDSEHFINELKASLPSHSSFSPLKYIFNGWRNNNNNVNTSNIDDKYEKLFKSILPKIEDVEKVMREKLLEVSNKKLALIEQGRFLKIRLDSCIIYNGDVVNEKDKYIFDFREYVSKLSGEYKYHTEMLDFNTELTRQRLVQDAKVNCKGNPNYITWSYMVRQLTRNELFADPDHSFLIFKLRRLKKCKNIMMKLLSSYLVVRESHSVNLESIVSSRVKLMNIFRSGSDVKLENSELNNLSETEGKIENLYDHSNCHDCSYVPLMALDCQDHYQKLSSQGKELSNRLFSLIEIREKILDIQDFHNKSIKENTL